MIGLGGPFVALILSGYDHLFLMAIVIILVYFSRFKLKAHNHAQLITGTFLAILLAYVELRYLFL